MVVWGYPCESKSSPAFKSKTPRSLTRAGCFFMGGVYRLNEKKTAKGNIKALFFKIELNLISKNVI
ncbi:hypothetical protein ACG9XR_19630, partial [Acinetobacter guillouiae]|uniref:hypothetical protein n=2 Tax=Acinetobacter guillouiae TaxID=106649 RepID=UPI003AF77208